MVPPGGPETLYYVPWQTATRNSHREDEHLIKRAQCVHLTDNRLVRGYSRLPLSFFRVIHPSTCNSILRSPRLPSDDLRTRIIQRVRAPLLDAVQTVSS